MRRGDLYWATLDPRSGSKQHGRRPVLVLSHDAFNQTPTWRSVIVASLSTLPQQLLIQVETALLAAVDIRR